MPAGQKKIYLTFDDGPHPEITPKVLQILSDYQVKATFFCVGQNVEKYPETYQNILSSGHLTGNHTFNHSKGWKVSLNDYLDNTAKAAKLIRSDYFRPPHGRITFRQICALKKQYKIVMWTVLSYDFDKETLPEVCLSYVLKHAKDGSIIVFHDSEKAKKNMLFALPQVLEKFTRQGFTFERLDGIN